MRPLRVSAALALATSVALACGGDDETPAPASSDAGVPSTPDASGGGDGASPVVDAGNDSAIDAGPDAPPPFEPAYFALNHVLSTGQSLSVGSQGTPILSTTQPFENVMFVTGVRAGGAGLTSFVPLVETGVETMSAGMSSLITDLARSEALKGLPAPKNDHRLLVSCHGIGGTAYVGLKKGTVAYQNGMAQVAAGMALAKAASLTYVVRAVTNVHGESDHVAMNAAYEQDLVDWQKDYETDVKAATGQTEPIPMFHTQMSSWTKYGQATSAIPQAQLDASTKSAGKIVMVGPKYFLAYVADGVHLSSQGYRHMGEYYAKAYRRVVLEGKAWEPVRPKTVSLAGDTVRVVFHVPAPPLAFDTTLVAAAVNQGFEYTDDSGAPPAIASVTLDGPDAVKIKLAAAPSAAAKKRIRYAFTGVAGATGGPTTGARGNLRDSDATPSRNGSPLWNWAVHFDAPIP